MARKYSGQKQGPILPARLEKELGTNEESAEGSGRQRGSMFAVSRRKVERKRERKLRKQRRQPKKAAGPDKPPQSTEQRPQQTRKRAAPPIDEAPRKKQKEQTKAATAPKNKPLVKERVRHELLQVLTEASVPNKLSNFSSVLAKGSEAMQAEEAYQQQLAKKLGLKGSAAITSSATRPKKHHESEEQDSLKDSSSQEDSAAVLEDQADSNPGKLHTGHFKGAGYAAPSAGDEDDVLYLPKGNLYSPADDQPSAPGNAKIIVLVSRPAFVVMLLLCFGACKAASATLLTLEAGLLSTWLDGQQLETVPISGRYVPPAARAKQKGDSSSAAVTGRVKGLLNRLAEANLQGIAAEAAELMQHAGRRQVADSITEELLQ
ncbi:hypothetical protein MMC29_000036, partial [Sticta canariensis]|nr:hypothetical protein [Sticta canariensis]